MDVMKIRISNTNNVPCQKQQNCFKYFCNYNLFFKFVAADITNDAEIISNMS